MPIKISENLPAFKTLTNENIFVMSEERAQHQDIRPLKIAILNLMPKKIETETQILRLIGNSPLQTEVTLLKTASYNSKNTSSDHLLEFYKTFDDIKHEKFDGMIVTGAPVEKMKFEDVSYWKELCCIFSWAEENVYSTMNICWGAQAALYYYYGIEKYFYDKKLSGVFRHSLCKSKSKLIRGFDDEFYIPHSRYTYNKNSDIEDVSELELLTVSDKAGFFLASSRDLKKVFVSGHAEYDRDTLKNEYLRDVDSDIKPEIPDNYFPFNDPENIPVVKWRSHANLLFVNWLNYAVYQQTPYELYKAT